MGNVTTAIMLAAICFLFLFGMIAIIRKQKEYISWYTMFICSFYGNDVYLQSLSALGLPELMQKNTVYAYFSLFNGGSSIE